MIGMVRRAWKRPDASSRRAPRLVAGAPRDCGGIARAEALATARRRASVIDEAERSSWMPSWLVGVVSIGPRRARYASSTGARRFQAAGLAPAELAVVRPVGAGRDRHQLRDPGDVRPDTAGARRDVEPRPGHRRVRVHVRVPRGDGIDVVGQWPRGRVRDNVGAQRDAAKVRGWLASVAAANARARSSRLTPSSAFATGMRSSSPILRRWTRSSCRRARRAGAPRGAAAGKRPEHEISSGEASCTTAAWTRSRRSSARRRCIVQLDERSVADVACAAPSLKFVRVRAAAARAARRLSRGALARRRRCVDASHWARCCSSSLVTSAPPPMGRFVLRRTRPKEVPRVCRRRRPSDGLGGCSFVFLLTSFDDFRAPDDDGLFRRQPA